MAGFCYTTFWLTGPTAVATWDKSNHLLVSDAYVQNCVNDLISVVEKKGCYVFLYPPATTLDSLLVAQAMLDFQCVRALSESELRIVVHDGGHVTLPEAYHVKYMHVKLGNGATFDGNGCTMDTIELDTVSGACHAYSIVVQKEATISAKDESVLDLTLGYGEHTIIHDHSDPTATLRLSYRRTKLK